MSDNHNLNYKIDTVNENFEKDLKMEEIKKEVLKKFSEYRNTLNYMAADAPIGILCLPIAIEKILLDNGLLRVYDLFDCDFVKIKGLGVTRIKYLTASLDKFFSML